MALYDGAASLFAGLAVLLALIGVYGVVSYAVAQRTQELGIRAALGAARTQLLGLVLRQSLLPVSVGVVAGLLGAFALSRFVASMLYEVQPTDPATYAIAAASLLGVALVASLVPARRAANADPIAALRHE